MANLKTHSRTPAKGETRRPRPEETRSAEKTAPTQVQSMEPAEPEDAYLTGASRSLQRRLLGLNVPKGRSAGRAQAERSPHSPAGQHAAGSFTGTDGKH